MTNETPEFVICSAIKLVNGLLFRGNRHSDCISSAYTFVMYKVTSGHPAYPDEWYPSMIEEQGFITSRNRFVDRKTAFMLQKATKIESKAEGGYRGEWLFSEDLY